MQSTTLGNNREFALSEATKVTFIANPKAGSASGQANIIQQLQQIFTDALETLETSGPDDAKQSATAACQTSDLIIAAGGDGTIQTIIDGMMASDQRPPLAIVPLGTANNLCRSLQIPLEAAAAVELLSTGQLREIDVASVSGNDEKRYFAGVASAGNTDRVIDNLEDEDKQRWGPWCYIRSALPVMSELSTYTTRIQFDGADAEQFDLWNLIIANSPFAAGGLRVAPQAVVDDGWLDVIMVNDGTPLDLATLTAEFLLGNYLEDPRVTVRRARHIVVEASPELRFLIDGEMVENQPFTFEISSRALRVVVPLATDDAQ